MYYSVEFRIESHDLVPDQISSVFGLQPCLVKKTGWRQLVDGQAAPALWSFDGSNQLNHPMREWADLQQGLQHVADFLLPHIELLRSYQGRYKLYWWCGQFIQQHRGSMTSTILSPEILGILAAFAMPFYLETYLAA